MNTRCRLWCLAFALAACSSTPRAFIAIQPGTEIVCTVRPANSAPVVAPDAGTPRLFERSLVLAVDAAAPATDAATAVTTDATARVIPDVDPERLVLLPVTTRAWAVARVARCEGARAVVLFHDGTTRAMATSSLRTARVQEGDEVIALWGAAPGSPYHAVVRSAHGRAIDLRYDDGTEETLDIARIERVMRSAVPPVATGVCPPPAGALPAVLVERDAWRTVGAVIECGGATALVRTVREGGRSVPVAGLSRVRVTAGDRVRVRWQDDADYEARVDRADGASLAVTYDDGSEETIRLGQLVSWSAPEGGTRAVQPFRCAP